jgi:hypothetical protein
MIINRDTIDNLFRSNIDLPFENIFKKKRKNGLMISFFNGYYNENIISINEGIVETVNDDNIDILLDNKIISNISKKSDIFKNITNDEIFMKNDRLHICEYNSLFSHLFIDKDGKCCFFFNVPKTSYYRIDYIYDILSELNNYCIGNIKDLKDIFVGDNIDKYYTKSISKSIYLNAKFIFKSNTEYYYDYEKLFNNIKLLKSYFDIVPKLYKKGYLVYYLV